MSELRCRNKPHGELYIDEDGKPGFQCHTPGGTTFEEVEAALTAWRDLIDYQLTNRDNCPVVSGARKAG